MFIYLVSAHVYLFAYHLYFNNESAYDFVALLSSMLPIGNFGMAIIQIQIG